MFSQRFKIGMFMLGYSHLVKDFKRCRVYSCMLLMPWLWCKTLWEFLLLYHGRCSALHIGHLYRISDMMIAVGC